MNNGSMEVDVKRNDQGKRRQVVRDLTRVKTTLSPEEEKAAENESINEIVKKLRMLSTSDRKHVTEQLNQTVTARVNQVSRYSKKFHDECMMDPREAINESLVIMQQRQGKIFIQLMKSIVATLMSERYRDGLKKSAQSVIYVVANLYLFARVTKIINMSSKDLHRALSNFTVDDIPDDLGKMLSGTCFKSEKKITMEELDRQFAQARVDTKMKFDILRVKHKTLTVKFDKAKSLYRKRRDAGDDGDSNEVQAAKDEMNRLKGEIKAMEEDMKHHDIEHATWEEMKKTQFEKITRGKMRGVMTDFNKRIKSWHDNAQLYLPVTSFSTYYDDYQRSVIRRWIIALLYSFIVKNNIVGFKHFIQHSVRAAASFMVWRHRELKYNENKDIAIIKNGNRDDCGQPKIWDERIKMTQQRYSYLMEYVLKKIPRGEAKFPEI